AEAADDCELVHLLRGARQQLADVDAGDRRRDGAERAAKGGVRLGVPALELADAAVEPDEEDLFALLLHLLRDEWRRQRAEGQPGDGPGRAAEPLAARQQVFARRAEGTLIHG